jgi:hypothetical protein
MSHTVPAATGAAAIPEAAAEPSDASPRVPARLSRLTRRTYYLAKKAWKYLADQIDLRHFPPSCCG